MRVIELDNAVEISKQAAEIIIKQVNKKRDSVIGFATGASPVETYKRIIESYEKGEVTLKHITTFNLDEYVGLERENVNSYYYFMKDNLFGKTDVDFDRVNFLSGRIDNVEEECARYNALLDVLQQDIQLLGLGSNGHIAFNEPGTPFGSVTHVVDLQESTIKDNARLFNDISEVPRQAFTMGLKNIMNAKKILILASGANKAKAVYGMINGEVTESLPASVLQLHPDCTLIIDEAAASLLK